MSNPLATSVDCGTFSLSTIEIADFLAGFFDGFTGHDNQAYFEQCIRDNGDFEEHMCKAVNDLMTMDNQ